MKQDRHVPRGTTPSWNRKSSDPKTQTAGRWSPGARPGEEGRCRLKVRTFSYRMDNFQGPDVQCDGDSYRCSITCLKAVRRGSSTASSQETRVVTRGVGGGWSASAAVMSISDAHVCGTVTRDTRTLHVAVCDYVSVQRKTERNSGFFRCATLY